MLFGVTWANVQKFFKDIGPFVPLLAGTSILSIAGLTPRLGPGRALILALKSKFRPFQGPHSLRKTDLSILSQHLATKKWEPNYLVITGEKSVGKTCLVKTATSYTSGVINVKVNPEDNEKMIIGEVLQSVTNLRFSHSIFGPVPNAKRVIFFYKLITGGRTPIVILNATERKHGDTYASLTGAVRTLTDEFQLRVS
jgi:hypothetical protein